MSAAMAVLLRFAEQGRIRPLEREQVILFLRTSLGTYCYGVLDRGIISRFGNFTHFVMDANFIPSLFVHSDVLSISSV